MTDTPSSLSLSTIRYSSSDSRFVSAAVGSSRMIILAFVESAFAISTICCCATLSVPISAVASKSAFNCANSLFASAFMAFHWIIWFFIISCPMKIFSATVRCG